MSDLLVVLKSNLPVEKKVNIIRSLRERHPNRVDECLSNSTVQLVGITSDQMLISFLRNATLLSHNIPFQLYVPRVAALELFLLTFCNERSSWDAVFKDLSSHQFTIDERRSIVNMINHAWGHFGFFSAVALVDSKRTREEFLKNLPMLPPQLSMTRESDIVEGPLTSDAYVDLNTRARYVSIEYSSDERSINYMLKVGFPMDEAKYYQDLTVKDDEHDSLSSIFAYASIQHSSFADSPYLPQVAGAYKTSGGGILVLLRDDERGTLAEDLVLTDREEGVQPGEEHESATEGYTAEYLLDTLTRFEEFITRLYEETGIIVADVSFTGNPHTLKVLHLSYNVKFPMGGLDDFKSYKKRDHSGQSPLAQLVREKAKNITMMFRSTY
jgi:hypothetical protein